MIGIDTNLVVRLLTNDDKKQVQYIVELIEKNAVFIAKSVLLETEWVLRYTYQLDTKTILNAFKKLLGLPQITIEDPQTITQTLQWYEAGFDFADALHLASSKRAEKFATLDKKFIKAAKKMHINLLSIG
ncbi:MAG: type II toxin-antitoxin system VapC family toxin [Gammaproteobacteria bacterium]